MSALLGPAVQRVAQDSPALPLDHGVGTWLGILTSLLLIALLLLIAFARAALPTTPFPERAIRLRFLEADLAPLVSTLGLSFLLVLVLRVLRVINERL